MSQRNQVLLRRAKELLEKVVTVQHSKGMPLYLLMERLGHSNLSTTQIYLRSLPSFCPEKKIRS